MVISTATATATTTATATATATAGLDCNHCRLPLVSLLSRHQHWPYLLLAVIPASMLAFMLASTLASMLAAYRHPCMQLVNEYCDLSQALLQPSSTWLTP